MGLLLSLLTSGRHEKVAVTWACRDVTVTYPAQISSRLVIRNVLQPHLLPIVLPSLVRAGGDFQEPNFFFR